MSVFSLGMLSGQEIVVIVVVLLLFFGASRLPSIANSLGRSKKEFKKGLEEEPEDKDKKAKGGDSAPADKK